MTIEHAEKAQELMDRRYRLLSAIHMMESSENVQWEPRHYQSLGKAVMGECREQIFRIIKEAHQKIEQEINSL